MAMTSYLIYPHFFTPKSYRFPFSSSLIKPSLFDRSNLLYMSSHKVLPSCPPLNNHIFFYKSPEIRFRELLSASLPKPPKRRILIQDDPWRALKQSEVELLVERLEDRPEQLYEAIKRRSRQKNKFILLEKGKENRPLLEAIEAKRAYYQGQFRSLLRDRKADGINIVLPKLDSVHYLFRDGLHKLQKIEKPAETPPEYE